MTIEEDIDTFLEKHKQTLETEKLQLLQNIKKKRDNVSECSDSDEQKENIPQNTPQHTSGADSLVHKDTEEKQSNNAANLVETLDLSCLAAREPTSSLRSDGSNKGAMLRYGQYSPSNSQLKLDCPALPYLGVGEYEQQKRRQLLKEQLQTDYKQHLNQRNQIIKTAGITFNLRDSRSKSVQTDIKNIHSQLIQYSACPSLETNTADNKFGDYGLHSTIESRVMHNNRSPVLHRLDQRITTAHNNLFLKDSSSSGMDKPTRGILTNRRDASRDRLLNDLKHTSYVPPNSLLDGFSYTERSEELERERIKRELYQNELRLQIEEKRRLAAMREDQERREQELENRRLEQQLMRMHEEQLRDEQRRNRREQMRRNSDDFALRKQQQELRCRSAAAAAAVYRKDAESIVPNVRSTTVASKLSHYSPPVSRRYASAAAASASASGSYATGAYSEPLCSSSGSRYSRYDTSSFGRKNMLNRMDSLYGGGTAGGGTYGGGGGGGDFSNSYRNSFSRYDSLSRIDSLKQQEEAALLSGRLDALSVSDNHHADAMLMNRIQRRHSATQQDLRRSPQLTPRRCSSGRFEDSLMGGSGLGCSVPLLKAHSPVARELKYSHAVNSNSLVSRYGGSSEALRKLEDRWQMKGDKDTSSDSSILSQMGAIRMQLQREQLRMDEKLQSRARDAITQTSKAVHN